MAAALTPRLFQTKDCVVKEPQQQLEETELLHMELHALETERVRLSLVEEKLVDILQLLQQLRDLVSGNSCVSDQHCSLLKKKKSLVLVLLVSFIVETCGLDQHFSTAASQPKRLRS